jgi:arylsulfatase A-like enzyme
MVSWPGHIKAGSVYSEPVSLLDVVPTSVAAASGKLPGDREYDGVDLLPVLGGKKARTPHDVLFWRREPLLAIRKDNWKLWESADTTDDYGHYQLLFDLSVDPDETTDLAASHPAKVKELDALVRQWSQGMSEPKWTSRPPVTFDVCGRTFKLPI